MKLKFLLLLLPFIMLPLVLIMAIRVIPGFIQPPLSYPERVYGGVRISQSFISSKPQLTGLGFSIKNPLLVNKKDLILSLYDENNNLIREVTRNGATIEDGKFVKFLFPVISDSNNKKISFLVSAPSANYDDALQVFISNEKPIQSEQVFVNGERREGSTAFVGLYAPVSIWSLTAEIVSNFYNRLYMDQPFFVIYSLIIISLLAYLRFGKKSARS